MISASRHGDLCLVRVDKRPEDLVASESKILMTGSGGNDHVFDHGTFYPLEGQDRFIIGYLEAIENTKLFHPDHGRIVEGSQLRVADLPPGIYELRRQQEYTHEGMRPVID